MAGRFAWNSDRTLATIGRFQAVPDSLLPLLHALQEEFGYIHEQAVPLIAKALNVSQAEVHGVVSFYHDFRTGAPGAHILKLCRGEACQSMGCDATIQHVEQRLGIKLSETTADGCLTIEAVYCLGNCALSPAAMLDGQPYGRVNPSTADTLIGRAKQP